MKLTSNEPAIPINGKKLETPPDPMTTATTSILKCCAILYGNPEVNN